MSDPKIVDNYQLTLDDDEENVLVTLFDENDEKTVYSMDRDMAEDFIRDVSSVLGLDEEEDDG